MMCVLPIDLNQYETCPGTLDIPQDGEFVMNLNLSSDTLWEEENNESAVLTIFIDGIYNNDIVIYNGSENHTYQQNRRKADSKKNLFH